VFWGLFCIGGLLLGANFCFSGQKMADERLVGGPCQYVSYSGQAQITSITPLAPDPSGEQKYEVKFVFIPNQTLPEGQGYIERKEFLLLIQDTNYPDKPFLIKNTIEVGKIMPCSLKVIIQGTCTPFLFKFFFNCADNK
jgi:hypothetical protein